MKKLLFRLVLAMVVIVPVLGVVGYFWLESTVVSAVEQFGTDFTGVETTVTKISLQHFGGKMRWHGQLKVADPNGFAGPHPTQAGTFDVELEIGSLLEGRVVFKKFEFDGLDIYIGTKGVPGFIGKALKDVLSADANAVGGQLGGDDPKEEAESEVKNLPVDTITIRNLVAHVKVLVGPELTIKVPLIEMKQFTGDEPKGEE